MGLHRLPQQRLANASMLAVQPHIELIVEAVAESEEAVDIASLHDPELALREHHIAHEPKILARCMQLRQERQARAEHKPQQPCDRLGALLIGASDHVQRLLQKGEFGATKISYARPFGPALSSWPPTAKRWLNGAAANTHRQPAKPPIPLTQSE